MNDVFGFNNNIQNFHASTRTFMSCGPEPNFVIFTWMKMQNLHYLWLTGSI
jgi:hypothetical protein